MSKRVILKQKDGFRDGTEKATVYPHTYKKRGVEYFNYIVRGWKENGKWQRKQFATEKKANLFADSVNVNLSNKGAKRSLHLTTLSESQLLQAENAFTALGDAYTLENAIEFFLRHHRAPEFTITITEGLKHYLDDKEREGVRESTRKSTRLIITRFATHIGDAYVHTVTESDIVGYLETLRSLDGVTKAKRKTYNNNRNELASFFIWSMKRDGATNRPWTFQNPTEHVASHSQKRVAEERPSIATTTPERTLELFNHLITYKGGKLVKYFALAYFAGIRPSVDGGESVSLAERESDSINLKTRTIFLSADMTKTKDSRSVKISDNLMAWLEAYKDMPIIPEGFVNDIAKIRKKFNLQNDETRHSFISYHVALHRSIGDAALEAGNSERMIKKHYLNHETAEDGAKFFSIVPDMNNMKAVFSDEIMHEKVGLKVI